MNKKISDPLASLLAAVFVALLDSLILMLAWNFAIVSLFHLPAVGYLHAICFFLIVDVVLSRARTTKVTVNE